MLVVALGLAESLPLILLEQGEATAPEAAQSARVPAKLIATNIRMVTTWYTPASGVASRSNAYV